MNALLHYADHLFNRLDEHWESATMRRWVGSLLIISFFAALIVIELNRQGLLPPLLAVRLPMNHFHAVDVAFSLFLVFEVIGLVFGLATSVADALGKQFEIFSLILLRQSFKELIKFDEPIQWTLEQVAAREAATLVVVDAVGALLIFAIIGYYYNLQRHRRITENAAEQRRFVAAKKLLALVLLVILAGLAVYTVASFAIQGKDVLFFDTFYTVLIFSDVLLVLISLRYSSTYHVVFRNSAFAAATVMIRLALAGPRYVDALIGVIAALFAVGLSAAYNYLTPVIEANERVLEQRAERITRKATDDEEISGEEADSVSL